MKQKKIPMRMCIVCQTMKSKAELFRLVKDKENEVFVDLQGKKPGRGAYICRSVLCLNGAKKSRRLERAFSRKFDDEFYCSIAEILEECNGK